MSEGLNKLAGAIGDTLKTAPTIYEDALQPAVQEVGKLAARIPRAINAAFSVFDKWMLNKEYNVEETKRLLEQKLKNVDPEKIVTPEAYVAIPAIQAISYSMDSKILRNLYANLLAKSVNSDTKDQVHPAYINIISQMTPLDAKILHYIINQPHKDFPVIDLIARNGISYVLVQPNITPITFASIEAISISLENLSRNNLIYITNDAYSEEFGGYNSIYDNENYTNYIEAQNNILPFNFTTLDKIEKACTISILGKSFCEICIS